MVTVNGINVTKRNEEFERRIEDTFDGTQTSEEECAAYLKIIAEIQLIKLGNQV